MFGQGWKRTLWRVSRRGGIVAALLGPIALAGLWLAFQHKPAWYQPIELDEEGYRRARRDAVSTADSISDQIVRGKTFEVMLTDHAVNEWLAALPRVWPEAKQVLPDELRDPAVRFADGRIRIGAHCEKDGWKVILNIDVAVSVSGDGTSLAISLAAVHGGSLPVPRAITERLLDPLLKQTRRGRDNKDADADTPWGTTLGDLRSAEQLFTGVAVRNRFVWPNGRRAFRIESIRITDGELRCRLQPL